jgi:hypothetical protein
MITTGATSITACGRPRLSSCWLRAVAVGTCTELAPLPPLGRSTPISTAIPARSLRVLLAETRRIRTFETSVIMDAAIASRKPSLTVSENSATVIGRPRVIFITSDVSGGTGVLVCSVTIEQLGPLKPSSQMHLPSFPLHLPLSLQVVVALHLL